LSVILLCIQCSFSFTNFFCLWYGVMRCDASFLSLIFVHCQFGFERDKHFLLSFRSGTQSSPQVAVTVTAAYAPASGIAHCRLPGPISMHSVCDCPVQSSLVVVAVEFQSRSSMPLCVYCQPEGRHCIALHCSVLLCGFMLFLLLEFNSIQFYALHLFCLVLFCLRSGFIGNQIGCNVRL